MAVPAPWRLLLLLPAALVALTPDARRQALTYGTYLRDVLTRERGGGPGPPPR
jgi:hypothetical protein